MIGKPKYKIGDKVRFTIQNTEYEGIVEIVDRFGTFEDNSNVSYDIMIEFKEGSKYYNPNGCNQCLMKHINENLIME